MTRIYIWCNGLSMHQRRYDKVFRGAFLWQQAHHDLLHVASHRGNLLHVALQLQLPRLQAGFQLDYQLLRCFQIQLLDLFLLQTCMCRKWFL